jgi:uncharacterized protein
VKLTNRAGGLCFTPIKSISEDACYSSSAHLMPPSGKLKNTRAVNILEEMWNGSTIKKTIGIAVLNALSSICWKDKIPRNYTFRSGINVLNEISISGNGFAVVIGDLVPAFTALKKHRIPYRVMELHHSYPDNEHLEFYIHPKHANKIVPEADLLIITGKTLINDTLEFYLNLKKPDAKAIVIGPTASMLPGAFFRRGVSSIGGTIVNDIEKVLNVVAEAGSGYHFFEQGTERIVINKIDMPKSVKKLMNPNLTTKNIFN